MSFLKNTDPTSKRLYDINMINKMCRGNQEQIVKMVEVFITQISQSVEAIKLAYLKKDLVRIENVIHKIKPTLTYFGTVKLEKELLLIEALIQEEFPTIELDLKIMSLDYLVMLVVDNMNNEFNITNKS